MDAHEFANWYDYHTSAFTSVASWLDKLGPARKGAILVRWQDILKPVELKIAKIATDKMFSGAIEEPRSFDKHPASIRSYAKAVGGAGVKEGAPDCICGGSGMLDVMADNRWKGKRALQPGERFNHRDHLVTVACPCPKGQWINECRERSTKPGDVVFRLETYDADTMQLFTAWWKHRMDLEHAARVSNVPPTRDVSAILNQTAAALQNPEHSPTVQHDAPPAAV